MKPGRMDKIIIGGERVQKKSITNIRKAQQRYGVLVGLAEPKSFKMGKDRISRTKSAL